MSKQDIRLLRAILRRFLFLGVGLYAIGRLVVHFDADPGVAVDEFSVAMALLGVASLLTVPVLLEGLTLGKRQQFLVEQLALEDLYPTQSAFRKEFPGRPFSSLCGIRWAPYQR